MIIELKTVEELLYIPVVYYVYPPVPTILFSIPFLDVISIYTVVRSLCVITLRVLSISVTIISVFITNSFII